MKSNSPKSLKYLMVGPMLMPDGSNLGGATVSLNYLVEYLATHHFSYDLLDTQYFKNPLRMLLNPIYTLALCLIKIPFVDVVFVNVSQAGTKTLAPILYVLTKIFGKTFIFRPFGGAMQDHYEQYANWQKWLFHKTLLKADIFFLQTRELVDFFGNKGKRIVQLPTSRYQPPQKFLRPNRPFQKKFVFLGHVNKDKGLDYLLSATQQLDASYTMDIYGPIQDPVYHSVFEKNKHYRGVLKKEEVLPTLQNYDVLVLPSFYRGEGYPGVVIEAYSLGLPVIATRWRAIPELVQSGTTGLLIATHSVTELVAAIRYFDTENYPGFAANARQFFCENFDAEKVTGEVFSTIEKLVRQS